MIISGIATEGNYRDDFLSRGREAIKEFPTLFEILANFPFYDENKYDSNQFLVYASNSKYDVLRNGPNEEFHEKLQKYEDLLTEINLANYRSEKCNNIKSKMNSFDNQNHSIIKELEFLKQLKDNGKITNIVYDNFPDSNHDFRICVEDIEFNFEFTSIGESTPNEILRKSFLKIAKELLKYIPDNKMLTIELKTDKLRIKEYGYLFSWDEILENKSERLIDFMKKNYNIDWVKTAKIEKIDNGKIIKVSAEKHFISLKLNNEKTKVNLKIDDYRIDEFSVRRKNGKLNICGYKYVMYEDYIFNLVMEKVIRIFPVILINNNSYCTINTRIGDSFKNLFDIRDVYKYYNDLGNRLNLLLAAPDGLSYLKSTRLNIFYNFPISSFEYYDARYKLVQVQSQYVFPSPAEELRENSLLGQLERRVEDKLNENQLSGQVNPILVIQFEDILFKGYSDESEILSREYFMKIKEKILEAFKEPHSNILGIILIENLENPLIKSIFIPNPRGRIPDQILSKLRLFTKIVN